MSDKLQEQIGVVIQGILDHDRQELQTMKQEDLEKFWFFRFDPKASIHSNIYEFNDLLGLYKRKCRDWEEMHHGHCCVVERVRDKYLIPKIKIFADQLLSQYKV